MFINFDDLFLPTLLFGTKIKPEHGDQSLKNEKSWYLSDAFKQILLENKDFFLKNIKYLILNINQYFFLSYMLIVTFDNFPPTRLFGTTCLLIFAKFSLLHAYLALHVYLEH